MRQVLVFMGVSLAINSFSQSQILRNYVFPEGIRKTTFNYTNSDGSRDESAKLIYEYLIAPEGATVFVSNFQDDNVLSRRKEEFYITDTAIYLVNINTENILSYKQENFLGYKNCFIKLPARGRVVNWTYKEGNTTSYKCAATFTAFTVSNVQYDAIKVDKTPFENGKYLDQYKTSVYYVEGKGLYKEMPVSGKKAIYTLAEIESDVVNKPKIKELTPDPIRKTDTIRIDLNTKDIHAFKAVSYSHGNSEGESMKIKEPTFFIWEGKNIYLIKDGKPIKHWHILKETSDPDGTEMTTKEGDILFVFGYISITNKQKQEVAYEWEDVNIKEVQIDNKYLRK